MTEETITYDAVTFVDLDERGRGTFGKEYADKQVLAYIVELPSVDEVEEEPNREVEKVFFKMWRWAKEEGYTPLGTNADGTVLTESGRVETPYNPPTDR